MILYDSIWLYRMYIELNMTRPMTRARAARGNVSMPGGAAALGSMNLSMEASSWRFSKNGESHWESLDVSITWALHEHYMSISIIMHH